MLSWLFLDWFRIRRWSRFGFEIRKGWKWWVSINRVTIGGFVRELISREWTIVGGYTMFAVVLTCRKLGFVECHIARHYNFMTVPESIPLRPQFIANKRHLNGLHVELPMAMFFLHVNVSFAPKYAEVRAVRLFASQLGNGAVPLETSHRLTIVDVNRCLHCEVPETVR